MSTTDTFALDARPRARAAWEEEPSKILTFGKGAVLSLVVLAVLFPMWSIVVTSLSSRATINAVPARAG